MIEMTPAVTALIDLALEEDLGRGDVTSNATVPAGTQAEGEIVAREPLVIAGLAVAAAVFRRVDSSCALTLSSADGDQVKAGAGVLSFQGPAASLLAAERTALNFLQRLSGVATLTRNHVEAVRGSGPPTRARPPLASATWKSRRYGRAAVAIIASTSAPGS
jgi:nicotinate-nucleotide pyrophosphorylase (carboxylating)